MLLLIFGVGLGKGEIIGRLPVSQKEGGASAGSRPFMVHAAVGTLAGLLLHPPSVPVF